MTEKMRIDEMWILNPPYGEDDDKKYSPSRDVDKEALVRLLADTGQKEAVHPAGEPLPPDDGRITAEDVALAIMEFRANAPAKYADALTAPETEGR